MSLKECHECGNKVSSRAKSCPQCGNVLQAKTGCLTYLVLILAIFIPFYLISGDRTSSVPDPVRASEPKASSNQVKLQSVGSEEKAESPDHSNGIIQVDPDTLINAYRNDEKTANLQYGGRLVAVTGVISGIITIPDKILMKAYEEGRDPDVFFIAMGGPPTTSASAWKYPGITAFFGKQHAAITGQLARGETVTIVCKCTGKFINAIDLRKCELQTQRTEEKASSETSPTENARDGRFVAYSNGTVMDTWTNLIWAAKDNGSNISWKNAKSYCDNYRGGGFTDWREPTQDELAGLYDKSKNYKSYCGRDVHLTRLIRLTCNVTWASPIHGVAIFYFDTGEKDGWRESDGDYPVLPVRSAK